MDSLTAEQPRPAAGRREGALPNVAFVFAGQGAQHPGMGAELAASEPAAQAVFDACDSVRPGTSQLCFEGTAEELKLTANTQPCMYAMDLACARALEARGVRPACVAGFSLGELAALAFAGAFDDAQGFSVVCERARLMDAACQANPGSMLAVLKLTPEKVEELAAQAGEVWPVNYNSPAQTVVAGAQESIDRLAALVREAGGRAMPLAVSGAFHSPYMQSASDGMREVLAEHAPTTPALQVWANATALPYPDDPEQICDLLARQVAHPVLWTRTLAAMAAQGVDTFVEVGPGKVLTGLVKRTLPDARALSCETPQDLESVLEALGLAGGGDTSKEAE